MNEEEKKAIERLEEQLNFWKKQNIKNSDCEIILNLITKLQKENEEKDKQIDLMARRILIYQMYNSNLIKKICNECGYEDCCDEISQDCIKKYFETKAKKGE